MARPRKPSPKHRITLNLQIKPVDYERLRRVAHDLGFIVPSGTHAGQGSISALVAAIAQGEIQLKKKSAKTLRVCQRSPPHNIVG